MEPIYNKQADDRRQTLAAALTSAASAPISSDPSLHGEYVSGAIASLGQMLQRQIQFEEYQKLQQQYLQQRPTFDELRNQPLIDNGNGNYSRTVPGKIP